MKRLLFVDDDASVLSGLQLTLRKQRQEWDMAFCSSAAKGLHALASAPFDVVVSDMQMPVMDGAQFLSEIRRIAPGTVRLVLTGHADKGAIIRALPVAQQILAKPCEPNAFRDFLSRACSMHTLINDERLKRLMIGTGTLPSVPSVYRDLSAALQNNAALKVVTEIVERDVAISGRVLQYANSAYFGMSNRVTTISKAVLLLGVAVVRAIDRTASIFDGASGVPASEIEALFAHSVQVARVAQKICASHPEETFTAALMHDIGQLVLMMQLPEAYAGVIAEMTKTRRAREEVENEKLGVTHAEVGAYLLTLWGLPIEIVEAVAHHHRPQTIESDSLNITLAVYFAEALCAGRALDPALVQRLGLADRIETWMALVNPAV